MSCVCIGRSPHSVVTGTGTSHRFAARATCRHIASTRSAGKQKRRPRGRLSHAGGWTPSRLPATSQILRTRVPLDPGGAKGSTEAPLVMNREIGRPSRALHAAGATRVGQSATHLVQGRLGILLAK